MKSLRIILLIMGSLLSTLSIGAQDYKNWVRLAPRLPDSFFSSDSATAVVENVLASQLSTGAWPKNVNFFTHREEHPEDELLGTIDNGATTTEIRFLMRHAVIAHDSVSFYAALKGIRYLLKMQYENGGFPQYYPRNDHYHGFITFNDNAMLNVLRLLDDVAQKKGEFVAVNDSLSALSAASLNRGIECILKCQILKDNEPTVWCQQHDPLTLKPQYARAYELPSYVSAESVDIVLFLMSIPNPSNSIRRAVAGAVKWFREHAIVGLERKDFVDVEGRRDFRMVACPQDDYACPRLWARFYDLKTDKPFFCGRDGVPHDKVEDIEYERRNGYAWFVTSPERLFTLYKRYCELK